MVFTRPCGERIPQAPMAFALTGQPPLLEQTQQQLGVSAETHRSRWDGARPDYGSAIEILDGHARKRFTMRRTAGEVTLLDTG
jgi:hypothetical protein